MKKFLESVTRGHIGLVFMATGFASLVTGVALHFSPSIAAMVAGGLLLAAGVAIDLVS